MYFSFSAFICVPTTVKYGRTYMLGKKVTNREKMVMVGAVRRAFLFLSRHKIDATARKELFVNHLVFSSSSSLVAFLDRQRKWKSRMHTVREGHTKTFNK